VLRQGGDPIPSYRTRSIYGSLSSDDGGLTVLHGDCNVSRQHEQFEELVVSVSFACTRTSEIALPVSYNAFSRVEINKIAVSYRRLQGDPRIGVDLPGGTSGLLEVHLPTLGQMLSR
jgi:hypothetical protein